MNLINRTEFPADHDYYRTRSDVYRRYLEMQNIDCIDLPGFAQFGWIKKLFGRKVQISKFERIDFEPTTEFLRSHGFEHGMVIWIPKTRTDIPAGWRKLWIQSHFSRTGFTMIDGPEYFRKWSERARRARKKFLVAPDVRIELVDQKTFVTAFEKTKVKHLYKSDYIKYYRTMMSLDPTSIRSYIAYHGDKAVAGLAVHDYAENSSVHMVAFTSNEAKPIQAGTGLIDRWFADSLDRGIRYINFDHLRDGQMTNDQQGYTDFKVSFIDHEVYFKDAYFRFV